MTKTVSKPNIWASPKWRAATKVNTRIMPSCTVPGQSSDIKTLIERHSKGLPISVNRFTPVYGKSGKDPMAYDLVELQQMAEDNNKKIQKLKAQAQEEIQQKKKQQEQKRFEEWKKEQEKEKTDLSA